jgi:hypothetical protein
MRLMQRPQITTLALPRSRTWPSELLPPHQAPFHFLPDVYVYAKFMLATPSYLIENLTRDLSELASERRILSDLDDGLGIAFCDAAEQRLHAQIAKATALDTDVLCSAIDRALQLERDIVAGAVLQGKLMQERECAPTPDLSDVPTHYLSTQTNNSHSPSPTSIARGLKSRKNLNPPPSTSAYYYYQAASGQPIFLHPLDIRVLSAHFGAYPAFPDSITLRVEAASEGSVDTDLRRRCKYLSHIPESADVVFVEADLKGVVGAEGLRTFEGAIKTRRARRREKGRRDERARMRAEGKEREKLISAATWTPSKVTSGSPAWVSPPEHELVDLELDQDVRFPAALPSPIPALAPQAHQHQHQRQQEGGAWGSRSFAAAANAAGRANATSTTSTGRTPARAARHDGDNGEADGDEWAFELDLDRAWHDLEMQRGGAGGRRRRARMLVLGGGGGRRR